MATKKTTEVLEIRPIQIQKVTLRLVGDTPLIMHAWSEKAKRMMLEAQMGKAKGKKKEAKSPADDFIRSLCVHADGDKQEPVRAVFALSGSAGYESVSVIMEDVDKRSSLLDMALKELSAFEKKYRILEELSEVFAAADRVIGQK